MDRPRNIGRRMFLHSTTGAALGMPFLASILPRGARAAATPPIKRFVAMQAYSGQIADEWYPTATPPGYRLKDAVFPGSAKADGTTYLDVRIPGTKHSWARLRDFAATGVSRVIGTQLDGHLDKINLLRGIDMLFGVSHNFGAYFGNYNGFPPVPQAPALPTIDQVMAYSPTVYPTNPRRRVLSLGTGHPAASFSFTNYGMAGGKIEMLSSLVDPALAFDAAFKGFTATRGSSIETRNRALINAVHEDYLRVSRNPRLGATDKQSLDRHMTFLADIERNLGAVVRANGCTAPARPKSIDGIPYKASTNVMALAEAVPLLLDVAAAAIRCDVTRVVTFNISKSCYYDAGNTLRASYHQSAGVAGDWHEFAHAIDSDPVKRGNFVAISRWIIGNIFGALLDRLDVPESDGQTYLDNSLVVLGNELGYAHYSTDVQTIMAGSAGGALKTGYYVDYIPWEGTYANRVNGFGVLIPGVPNTRWLVTMMQAMGLRPVDYERPGIPGYGPSTVFRPPDNWPAPDLGSLGTPLPGITARTS